MGKKSQVLENGSAWMTKNRRRWALLEMLASRSEYEVVPNRQRRVVRKSLTLVHGFAFRCRRHTRGGTLVRVHSGDCLPTLHCDGRQSGETGR